MEHRSAIEDKSLRKASLLILAKNIYKYSTKNRVEDLTQKIQDREGLGSSVIWIIVRYSSH